jgi:hypothetical protein
VSRGKLALELKRLDWPNRLWQKEKEPGGTGYRGKVRYGEEE